MHTTKFVKVIVFFLAITINCSCEKRMQKVELDEEVYRGMFSAMVNVSQQTMRMNTRLIQSINGINTMFSFLMHDPQSRKTTKIVLPISRELTRITNKADDIYLDILNTIVEKEEGKKNWFVRNPSSNYTSYSSFYKLNNVESSKWTTKLLGTTDDESNSRAEYLRETLIVYRDNLIMAVADSIKNDRNQLKIISRTNLINFETFKSYLKSIEHPNRAELLNIYLDLTIDRTMKFNDGEILWNRLTFHNQPMISAITTITSYRNKIRFAQEIGCKMLLSRIERPLKPLYEYQK